MVGATLPPSYLPLDINVLTGTAIAGMLIKMFFGQSLSNDGETGPATAAIWGYGVTALSLVGILVVSLALASRGTMGASLLQFLKSALTGSLPVVLLLGIIAWLVSMNVQFFTRINQGKVAPEYDRLSTASSVLIALQFILLLKFLRDKAISARDRTPGGTSVLAKVYAFLSTQISMFLYVLGAINLVLLGSMQVVLQFFSTDG
jgi:hypothetical protein